MWLVLTAIVVASAIGFNVLALWLTGYFERKQPESRNTKADADLPAHWAAGERLSTFC
jgi:multisubunit Na+/H+ antiporter MnhC subunit